MASDRKVIGFICCIFLVSGLAKNLLYKKDIKKLLQKPVHFKFG
jgi:hypothetical protein